MCSDYLLTMKCKTFELNGKCLHSHSLFTTHNEKILRRKYNLSADTENAFEVISDLIRKSKSSERVSSRFEQPLTLFDDREDPLVSKQINSFI